MNQINTMANIVPIGIAPEDCTEIKKKFNTTKTRNKIPGTKTGVKTYSISNCHHQGIDTNIPK